MYFGSIKSSRLRVLAIIVGVLMAIFIVRLFYLQVIKHSYYVSLATKEQQKQWVLPAKRGEIYAMDGELPVPLVMNTTVYTMFADPKVITDKQKIIDVTKKVAGGNARSNLDNLLSMTETRYQILATKLTRKQAEMIKEEGLVGIGFQEESQRVYPEGKLAAHALGFVNTEGEGQYGLEEALNGRLIGTDGMLRSVTDVSNVPLTIGNNNIEIPAKDGDDIVMTIDRNIQSYVEKALAKGLKETGATHGSVTVMDPQSGKILAMTNLPTYNPAEYYKVKDGAVFNNGTISAPYEPGSDVKTLTMAIGIDKGVVSANSTYNNTDYIKVEDRTITNATKGQLGNITFQKAMNYSLNTGFVTVAQRLGSTGDSIDIQARNTMYSYFHDKLGLGELTGIELANEARGTVISPQDQDGGAVRYSNMAFGQGMDVTMVQMCSAFSTIVNGGRYYSPTILAGVMKNGEFRPDEKKPFKENVIEKSTSDQITKIIHDARAAFYSGGDKKGYYIGGKTGTSQTIENGVYVNDQTVGTYLGFGGDSKKSLKYVIMVQVSGKKMYLEGNKHAMPIFTNISNWLLDYMKLQPKG